jgi:hypothetical protein
MNIAGGLCGTIGTLTAGAKFQAHNWPDRR